MPVNSLSDTKRVDKPKLSLSLNRRKSGNIVNKNNQENTKPVELSNNLLQQDRASKRPHKSTYLSTLNAAKKLKSAPLGVKNSGDYNKLELVILEEELTEKAAMNGDHQPEGSFGNGVAKKTPVATLANLGNTCFLNSVLYTLRYAPRFLHNLHHLVADLSSVEQKLGSIRLKSSSLGRSAAGLAASGTRSWSSKDLLSLGHNDYSTGKSKIQIATEKLHETFASMRSAETKCLNSTSADSTPEPFAADAFLTALTHVNSTFEGNRQQDAHELLICILNNIRETCRALSARAAPLHLHENGDTNGLNRQPSLENDNKPTLAALRKSWKKRKDLKTSERRPSPPDEREATPPDVEREERTRPGWDFVAEDFEGTMVMRTRCMECEAVTALREPMSDVCVPVPVPAAGDGEPGDPAEPFRAAATAPDLLRDSNKYWCSVCLRYVEARRSASYSRLPRLLVLQLKRFSGGMQKITRHSPTPVEMPCFCEHCTKDTPKHRYTLWAVIMHLGQTLTGGHYVAYTRDDFIDVKCERDGSCDVTTTNNTSSSFMRTLFNRPRAQPTSGCAAKECCVNRPRSEGSWLACDDDLVKPISNEEFEDLLSAEPKNRSAATPYLLFYVKSEVG